MTEIAVFSHTGADLRTVMIDGDPWFVAADLCSALGIANPSQSVSYLDDDEFQRVPAALITNEGRPQDSLLIVNEPGMYSLILRSRKPEAKAFKRWITHEVLPALRKTGRYEVEPKLPKTYTEALRELLASTEREEAANARLAEVEPKAESWDTLAAANGDWSVADAAKVLSRDPNITIGQQRLFNYLGDLGWAFRGRGDNRWRVTQAQVETGRMSEMPSSHYHPRTGELVLDSPQVRITTKGLHELHRRLGGSVLELSS